MVMREPTVNADPEQAAAFFFSLWSPATRNANERIFAYCPNLKSLSYRLYIILNGHCQRAKG